MRLIDFFRFWFNSSKSQSHHQSTSYPTFSLITLFRVVLFSLDSWILTIHLCILYRHHTYKAVSVLLGKAKSSANYQKKQNLCFTSQKKAILKAARYGKDRGKLFEHNIPISSPTKGEQRAGFRKSTTVVFTYTVS